MLPCKDRKHHMHHDPLNDAIRAKLEALVAIDPTARKTRIETTLDPHRNLIAAAIGKGHTYRSIATVLRDAGLKASPETIRRYVQRIDPNGSKKTSRTTRRASLKPRSARRSKAPEPSNA